MWSAPQKMLCIAFIVGPAILSHRPYLAIKALLAGLLFTIALSVSTFPLPKLMFSLKEPPIITLPPFWAWVILFACALLVVVIVFSHSFVPLFVHFSMGKERLPPIQPDLSPAR